MDDQCLYYSEAEFLTDYILMLKKRIMWLEIAYAKEMMDLMSEENKEDDNG